MKIPLTGRIGRPRSSGHNTFTLHFRPEFWSAPQYGFGSRASGVWPRASLDTLLDLSVSCSGYAKIQSVYSNTSKMERHDRQQTPSKNPNQIVILMRCACSCTGLFHLCVLDATYRFMTRGRVHAFVQKGTCLYSLLLQLVMSTYCRSIVS